MLWLDGGTESAASLTIHALALLDVHLLPIVKYAVSRPDSLNVLQICAAGTARTVDAAASVAPRTRSKAVTLRIIGSPSARAWMRPRRLGRLENACERDLGCER